MYNEYNIVKIKVEFYEFYEELVNEFNEKENDVKIINCDEKTLKNLRQDWESLNTVREFVKKSKNKLEFKDENADNENKNNNENKNKNNNENQNENIINVDENKNNENNNEEIMQL